MFFVYINKKKVYSYKVSKYVWNKISQMISKNTYALKVDLKNIYVIFNLSEILLCIAYVCTIYWFNAQVIL